MQDTYHHQNSPHEPRISANPTGEQVMQSTMRCMVATATRVTKDEDNNNGRRSPRPCHIYGVGCNSVVHVAEPYRKFPYLQRKQINMNY